MTREELNIKNKADLLAMAALAALAVTPAMTKGDIIEVLLANAQMGAAGTPPPIPTPTPAAPAPVASNDTDARIATLEKQLAQVLSINATQAADLATARAAAVTVETDKLVADNGEGLPKEGALRALDGSLAGSRKMRVTIMATESDKEDVKVGVNGHLVQIKRGVPVVIDEAYVEVLRNSTIDTIVEDDNGKRAQVQMQRYPFTAEPA